MISKLWASSVTRRGWPFSPGICQEESFIPAGILSKGSYEKKGGSTLPRPLQDTAGVLWEEPVEVCSPGSKLQAGLSQY